MNKVIKKKIRHLFTQKLVNSVYIKGKGYFNWNSVWKVYNSDKDYSQLSSIDLEKINWEKSK